MAANYGYKELIVEALSSSPEPLSPKEIWQRATELGLDKKLTRATKAGSDEKFVTHQVGNYIYKNRELFYQPYPRKAIFGLNKDGVALEDVPARTEQTRLLEKHLHAFLVKFVDESHNFGLKCKSINANTTGNGKGERGSNKWLHPDIVGVDFLHEHFGQDETKNFLTNYGQAKCKIFAFELKRELNNSNLKESYFQAVSNSSWANEGYLVTHKLEADMGELDRLNNSFGIGLIQLDLEDPVWKSEILLRAKERELDLATMDRLNENADFRAFTKNINEQLAAGPKAQIKDATFDPVLDNEELERLKNSLLK